MLVWLPLLATVSIASVQEVPNPRDRDAWVTDSAEVLAAEAEQRLEEAIARIHADTTIEIAVVTLDDVPGTPKAFATELFNYWGIGTANENNGILVLLVMQQRRLEIEIGIGMEELLPASWLGQMQADYMVPHFKRGDFGAGLLAGLAEIMRRLRTGLAETEEGAALEPSAAGALAEPIPAAPIAEPRPAVPQRTRPVYVAEPEEDVGEEYGSMVASILGLLLFGGAGFGYYRYRKWRRTCPHCKTLMMKLDEARDDAYLQPGQRREEQIGSRDYEVRLCGTCQFSRVIRHTRLLSGYGRCPSCGFKANKRTTRTLVAATYSSGGQVEVTECCANCAHNLRFVRYTAKLTRSSSSSSGSSSWGSRSSFGSSRSSSSSSSFGGGRSRGGGAGSSW